MGLVGAALGAAGSIWGGIQASRAGQKARRQVLEQKAKNQNWYDRKYNEDPTQRADAMNLINNTEERIRQRNRGAEGTAAVMGGTNASVASEKEANAMAMAQTMGQVVAGNNARKDMIDREYNKRDAEISNQLAQIEQSRANAIAQAIGGVASAASQMDFGEGELFKAKKKEDK